MVEQLERIEIDSRNFLVVGVCPPDRGAAARLSDANACNNFQPLGRKIGPVSGWQAFLYHSPTLATKSDKVTQSQYRSIKLGTWLCDAELGRGERQRHRRDVDIRATGSRLLVVHTITVAK